MHPAPTRSSPASARAPHATVPAASHGQMTAVMRAMAPRTDAPRALRVGVVRNGRVVDERLFKTGAASVTIGESEDASLIVAGVPRAQRLFTEKNGQFWLHPLVGLHGRVALSDATHDVGALGAKIALDVKARGRLSIGDTTLLFQLVEAPAVAARPMLPIAVKTSLLDIVDWPLTILVAMSFLLHFGLVGAMYSDWTDRVVDESFTVQGLVDMSRPLPPPIVEDPERPTPTTVPATTATPTATNAAPSPAPRRGTNDARPARDPNAGLVEAAERMRLDLLATTAPGSAVADALKRSNIPPVNLDQADAPISTGGDLSLHNAGPIDPSARHSDLASIPGNTRKDANDHVAVNDTPGPQYNVDARPIPGVVRVPSMERTVMSLRPAFRRCYELGLQQDPTMTGDVTINVRLRATGEVDTADVASVNGLSPTVAQCIRRKVATAEFEKPEGGSATFGIPVKFVRQR